MNNTVNPELIAAKIRDTTAAAQLKEYKLAILQGEYVKVSDVNKRLAEDIGKVKSRLLGMSARLVPYLAGKVLDASEVKARIDAIVYEALTELADSYTGEE